MDTNRVNWDKVIDELTAGQDLSREEGRAAAYEKCISYAEENLAHDLNCNAFLAHAATRLRTSRVALNVIRDQVSFPDSARLQVSFHPEDGMAVTGNRDGLRYLAELFTRLASAPLGEQVAIFGDEPPFFGDTSGITIFLEDDQWFEDADDEYLAAMEEQLPDSARELKADEVFAVQFPFLPVSSLALNPRKIYLVREVVKQSAADFWVKRIREDDARFWIFTITDDAGQALKLGLDLDDPEVYFYTRQDLDQFLQ